MKKLLSSILAGPHGFGLVRDRNGRTFSLSYTRESSGFYGWTETTWTVVPTVHPKLVEAAASRPDLELPEGGFAVTVR
jgi:hypothetical protein